MNINREISIYDQMSDAARKDEYISMLYHIERLKEVISNLTLKSSCLEKGRHGSIKHTGTLRSTEAVIVSSGKTPAPIDPSMEAEK